MARWAGALSIFLGVGFGLPCLYGIWVLARRDEVAIFLGYPTYGGGPFESAGLDTTVALLVAFLVVCVAEVVVGVLLWARRRAGLIAALWLLPFEVVFWVGFSLPFGPLLGAVRTVLVVAALWTNRQSERVAPRD